VTYQGKQLDWADFPLWLLHQTMTDQENILSLLTGYSALVNLYRFHNDRLLLQANSETVAEVTVAGAQDDFCKFTL
jgi:hypothetical protein